MVAINPIHAEIFGTKCQFCHFFKKGIVFALIISGVPGPILIKFAQYVEKILPLNVFESKLQQSNSLENASMLNKGHFANFKIVAFSMPTVQLLKSKTLVSLIRISPNFHTMYRNDCQLTCRNQDCDFPIHFRTLGSKSTTIVNRQITEQFAISLGLLDQS